MERTDGTLIKSEGIAVYRGLFTRENAKQFHFLFTLSNLRVYTTHTDLYRTVRGSLNGHIPSCSGMFYLRESFAPR